MMFLKFPSTANVETRVTSAPILADALASAIPIFPEELFVMYLTGSIFSLVPPAVISIFLPKSFCRAGMPNLLSKRVSLSSRGRLGLGVFKIFTVSSNISSGSLIRPTAFVPQAKNPSEG